jgi:hypothetical protein
MATESNLNTYYEELIASLADRAYEDLKSGGYGDESECIYQAIDDGLIYYTDQAYILAHMLQGGFISWGDPISWDVIFENLYDDVASELEELKEKEGGEDDEQ